MYMRLLGSPEVEIATGAVRFLPERRFQVLAYLACRGDWVSRDHLATLFYADRSNDAARSNLRKVLLQVRAFEWLGDTFESERGIVRWRVPTDLGDFRIAMAQGEHERVLALYRGRLLAGLESADSAAFAAWLDDERGRIHAAWRASALGEAQHGAPADRLARTQLILADDPLDEDAMAASLEAMIALGRTAEAGRSLRDYEKRLFAELGVTPSARIRALFAAIPGRAAKEPAAAAATAGDFIGRERELEELRALLGNPECRLLTVTGPGGIGKSRLVKEVIRGLADRYADGVTWVPLDDLTETGQVGARVAAALGVPVLANIDPLETAARHLSSREVLLVLDNSEHLARLDAVVARLLAEAPRLRLLSTSRARIGAAHEWLLPLTGLQVPADGDDASTCLDSDAVRLFVATARAAEPRFDAAANSAAIASLVRIVAGMPLAILLAAGWVRLMPVSALASAVATSLDVLERAEEGEERPEHRSVRATFDQSWQMLAAQEQRALAAMSVFAGGFARDAAREVADAPLPLLAALVDKSLVQVASDGRFSLHPLIQQFAAGKLAALPGESVARRDRHADAVARFMQPYENFDAVDQVAALRAIKVELPNLLAAWDWSISRPKFDVLKLCAPGLGNYFQGQGPVASGAVLFARAQAAVEASAQPDPGALFAIAIEHASLSYWLGDHAGVESAARKALKAGRMLRHAVGIRTSLNTLGLSLLRQGRPAEAHRFIDEALKRARADRVPHEVSAFAGNLVGVKQDLGDAEGAHRLALEAFEGHRANNHLVGQISMCNELGLIEHRRGRLEPAGEWFERGLRMSESAGQTLRMIQFLTHLGTIHLDRGELAAARRCCEQSLAMALDKGVRSLEPTCRRTMAAIELACGHHAAARSQLEAALGSARAIGTDLIIIPLLRDCALFFESRGEPAIALRLLASAEAHRTSRAALLPRFQAQHERMRVPLEGLAKDAVPALIAALDDASNGLERLA
ncbi:MAG: tetratricopeptide repeat protein [Caldimonas sp.]